MEKELNNIKIFKQGVEYLTIKIPKSYFKTLPEGYFFGDIIVKDIRGGKT